MSSATLEYPALVEDRRVGATAISVDMIGQVNFRCDGTKDVLDAAEAQLDARFPRAVGHSERSDAAVIHALGPNEWLLVVPLETAGCTAERLRELSRMFVVSATDVSHNRLRFRVSGEDTIAIMKRGCAIDFESPLASVGSTFETLLSAVDAVVHRPARDGIELLVRNSFGEYTLDWLEDAAASAAQMRAPASV